MDFSEVRLGARIEFYEQLDGVDGRPTNYLAAADKDPAFVGTACPAKGEFVSAVSLAGGTAGPLIGRFATGRAPFLPVAYVEHYLVALNTDEEILDWWEPSWRSPSAALVFYARADKNEDFRLGALAEALRKQGWIVHPANIEGRSSGSTG